MQSPPETSKPSIVILALDQREVYNDVHKDFNSLLARHADVEQVTTPAELRAVFGRETKPAAILCADASLTISTRMDLAEDATSYVRSGGTVIFMGCFSSFARWPDINVLFSRFNVPWRSGAYTRCTMTLNPKMTLLDTAGLATGFYQKALQVKDVAGCDAVYFPDVYREDYDDDDDEEVDVEARNAAALETLCVAEKTQTPAAFASVGAGKLGFVGDVNNEPHMGTRTMILRMCGLGSFPGEALQ
jgi:hypothetical protein